MRLNTVRSQDSLRLAPSLEMAYSFCSAVRYHAALWMGRSGMNTQPNHVNDCPISHHERIVLPNKATGIVMTETMMKIHFHAGRPSLPERAANSPAWIQPPAIDPK